MALFEFCGARASIWAVFFFVFLEDVDGASAAGWATELESDSESD